MAGIACTETLILQSQLNDYESSVRVKQVGLRRIKSKCAFVFGVRHRLLRPSVFQARDLVEHDFPIFVIHPIRDEVALPLKLELVVGLGLREAGFDVGGDGL